jgi:hypothetical protein
MEHWALTLSERCYRSMLSLYPLEFRIRFRNEMAQVFRDSCRNEIESGRMAALFWLWMRALVDLLVSVSRERGRFFPDLRSLPTHASGLIDSVVILAIIVFHLLTAGAGLAWYMPRTSETTQGFFLVSAGMGAALGGFGVICSMVLSRFRRIHYRLITL